MSEDPQTLTCPKCEGIFHYRSNKTFCSAKCRKASSQNARRAETPANAANSRWIKREQHELFDLATRMAETLYTMPPAKRLGYLEEVIQTARSGRSSRVKKVLTMPNFLYPDTERRRLFFRGSPGAYRTISQAADRYCRSSLWGASVVEVVAGEAPEPPTGEIRGEEHDYNEVTLVRQPPERRRPAKGIAPSALVSSFAPDPEAAYTI